MTANNTLTIIHACWEAGCSHRQIAAITKELSGTWLSEAAIADHINDFESELVDRFFQHLEAQLG